LTHCGPINPPFDLAGYHLEYEVEEHPQLQEPQAKKKIMNEFLVKW
jgi:hypothetical protein